MSRGRSDCAMAEQIDRDHPVATGREVLGQRPVHLLGQQHTVDEDQRARAGRRALRRSPAPAGGGDGRRAAAELGVGDALTLELGRKT